MKYIKQLPNLFNPETMKNFSVPQEYKQVLKKKKPSELTIRHENAKKIYEKLVGDKDVNTYSKHALLYNFFRISPESKQNPGTPSSPSEETTDIFIEEAGVVLTEYEKESFENNIEAVTFHILQLEVIKGNPKKNKVYIKSEDSDNSIKFKGGRDDKLLLNKFIESFIALVNATYIFIPIEEKLKRFKELYNKIYTLKTTEFIKSTMLSHFYELVYLITVYRNWVGIEEALRILEIEEVQ